MSGGKVAKILDNETDQDAVVDIYNLLLRPFEENPDGLSMPEKNICYIEELDNEVNMEGLKMYFQGQYGGHAHELISALREINSVNVLRIAQSAIEQFPNASVPTDSSARRILTQQLESSAGPVWESLDNEFAEYQEDIYALMTDYMRRNLAAFR